VIEEACDRIGFHRPVHSMKPSSALRCTLYANVGVSKGRVNIRDHFLSGLSRRASRSWNMRAWSWCHVSLHYPKLNGGCMRADSLQEVARYISTLASGLKTLVVHPI
jgi:hypothetical protein